MGLFDFLNSQKREELAGKSADSSGKSRVRSADYSPNGIRVNGQDRALMVSAWYCGLAKKANTFSQLVLEYQKQNDKTHGGNYEPYNRAEGRVLNYLCQVRPNQLMTSSQMLKQAVIMREVYGNAVFYIERDDDLNVAAIWLCDTATLDINTMTYTISYKVPGGILQKTVNSDDVWHWRNTYTYDNGLTGVGTLHYACNALSTAATNDKQAYDISSKGGKYKILLREEQKVGMLTDMLTMEQKDGASESLENALNSGHDVITVNGMLEPTIISQGAAEMNLLQSRGFDIPQIARYLQVPLVMLYDYTNNTYKAPEQAMQEFRQGTIAPMAVELEQEINAKTIGRYAYPSVRFHFNEDALMRLDPMGMMVLAEKQQAMGVKCVNEIRQSLNLPAIGPEGDRHLVSTNLQPLDNMAVQGKEVTQ